MKSRFTMVWVPGPSSDDLLALFIKRVHSKYSLSDLELDSIGSVFEAAQVNDHRLADLWADCFLAQLANFSNISRAVVLTAYVLFPCDSLLGFLASAQFPITNETAALVAVLSKPLPTSCTLKCEPGTCSLALPNVGMLGLVHSSPSKKDEAEQTGELELGLTVVPSLLGLLLKISLTNILALVDFDVQQIFAAVECKSPILLEGPPGVGKTVAIERTAKALGFSFVRINLCAETTVDDLFGSVCLVISDFFYFLNFIDFI